MRKIIVTGGNGQLGTTLRKLTEGADREVLFTDVDELDLTDPEAVEVFFNSHQTDLVINCAAYTAVDKAESELEKARKINVDAVKYLAEAANRNNFRIIHISTDYVFSGKNETPYKETDVPEPQTVYGKTKLEGEQALMEIASGSIILRTSWLYSEYGNNFVKTMLRLAREGKEIKVVNDQWGSPTYSGDLAKAILKIIGEGNWFPGIYNFTDEGITTWFDFATEIFRVKGLSPVLSPSTTEEFAAKAPRPHYSVLSKEKVRNTFGVETPDWKASLAICLKNL